MSCNSIQFNIHRHQNKLLNAALASITVVVNAKAVVAATMFTTRAVAINSAHCVDSLGGVADW